MSIKKCNNKSKTKIKKQKMEKNVNHFRKGITLQLLKKSKKPNQNIKNENNENSK